MLDHFLVYHYPIILETLLACWAGLLAANARTLAAELGGLFSRRAALGLALISLLALALRLWACAGAGIVYYDEYDHLDISRNLWRRHVFASSLVGGDPSFEVFTVPWWPAGFHVLLSLAARLSGLSLPSALRFNSVLGALSVALMGIFAAHLWRSQKSGLWSALLLAILPTHWAFSASAGLSAASLFWTLMSLLTLSVYLRCRSTRAYLLLLASLAYTAHCRPENSLLALCALGSLAWLRGLPARSSASLGGHLCLASCLALAAAIPWRNRITAQPGYAQSLMESLSCLGRHGLSNLWYFLDPLSPHVLLVPLALYGALKAPEAPRARTLLLPMLTGFFLVYSGFAAGDLAFWDSNRYALTLYAGLVVFAGAGLSCPRWPRLAQAAAFASYAALSLQALAGHWRELEPQRLRHRFLLEGLAHSPPEHFLVTHAPAAVIVSAGRPAVSAAFLLENWARFMAALEAQGRSRSLVFFNDYWRHSRLAQHESLLRRLRLDYDFSPLARTRLGDQEYAFHLLKPR